MAASAADFGESILEPLIHRLSSLHSINIIFQDDQSNTANAMEEDSDGLQLCHYYLRSTYNVIQHANDSIWDALNTSSSYLGKIGFYND